jgi:uncharacterized membrane protein YqiK
MTPSEIRERAEAIGASSPNASDLEVMRAAFERNLAHFTRLATRDEREAASARLSIAACRFLAEAAEREAAAAAATMRRLEEGLADLAPASALVEEIKKGEYVRRKADAKTTYIRGAYIGGAYSLTDAEDTNREIFVKRGTRLFIGFTY